MSDEPSIETMMLMRFLEAASAHDILRWHKAEILKAVEACAERADECTAEECHCGDQIRRIIKTGAMP